MMHLVLYSVIMPSTLFVIPAEAGILKRWLDILSGHGLSLYSSLYCISQALMSSRWSVCLDTKERKSQGCRVLS